ncbi:YqgE/AlgH family protein [Thermobifida cellulosilytica]|mgnify:CR=1 FL=1|uniref:UPF0301 protein AC529_13530 n=1 Tax=Thermobifida cellulosilytica TB100 TaxID=665004 RepID=A0A147KG31_THECS|nr:YqgE/AlgH family protein [Thermobifida cellulosilytica]KUP96228.1 hypothetical protein AC529_13530 [Thermobifida cellulosilytica TB100]
MDRLSLTGTLLVATPLLRDPNFYRSVVFVIDDDPAEGTLGVIVNRPSDLEVGEVLADWGRHASHPAVMFAGGPVGTDAGLALAEPANGQQPLGWRSLEAMDSGVWPSGLGMVDLDAPPQLVADALRRFRVFAGYAGWSPGQLRAEIDEGAWYVLPATADDVFCDDPHGLWSRVLRRQGGELAFVATFPDDPTLN